VKIHILRWTGIGKHINIERELMSEGGNLRQTLALSCVQYNHIEQATSDGQALLSNELPNVFMKERRAI
jgi:hypothetical protein